MTYPAAIRTFRRGLPRPEPMLRGGISRARGAQPSRITILKRLPKVVARGFSNTSVFPTLALVDSPLQLLPPPLFLSERPLELRDPRLKRLDRLLPLGEEPPPLVRQNLLIPGAVLE